MTGCTCQLVWNSILPPPPCPVHSLMPTQCCGFGCVCGLVYTSPTTTIPATKPCDEDCGHLTDDTVPIQLVVCEHTDSPWCPRCAGGLQ